MSEQLKDKCAVCGGYLFSDDDIVHCPECGAPHHRDCYAAVGHCGMQEYHGTEKQYSNSDTEKQIEEKGNICNRCGKPLPQDSKYCPFCAKSVDETDTNNDEQDFISFGPGGIRIDPYGGVDKESEIDGVKVKILARFVAFTPNRIIPKFKKFFDSGKRVSWNWMGFISPFSHAFFRKMNGAFFAYLLLEITAYVLITPFYNLLLSANLPINYTTSQLSEYVANNMEHFMNPAALLMATLGFLLLIGMRVYAGLFNDWHYMRHSIGSVKAIQKNTEEEEEIQLRKKGGVRPFLAFLFLMASTYFSSVIPAIVSSFLL